MAAAELLQGDDGLVTVLRRYDDYLRRCLCACLDFGFAIIGMIALATPDPGEDRVKRLIMELQALNGLKNDAVAPYQRPE